MWTAVIIGGTIALVLVTVLVGAWFVSIPLLLFGGAAATVIALNRKRRMVKSLHDHSEQAATDKVGFTDRDRQTLTSE